MTNQLTFLPEHDPAWAAYPQTVADIGAVLSFDTETTGVDFNDDRIVTAHVSTVAGSLIQNPLDLIIDAGVSISDGAAAVHGVTNERRIAEGIPEADAVAQLAGRIQDAIDANIPLVAFNGTFDFTMLSRALDRHGLPQLTLERAVVIDPFVLDKALDKYRRGKRQLGAVAAHYGVTLDDAHDADADAVAAAQVLFAMVDRHPQLGRMPLSGIGAVQQRAFHEQTSGLEAYFRRQGTLEAPLNKHWLLAPERAV